MRRRRSRSRTCASSIWSSGKGAPSSSGINKWDLVKPPPGALSRLREETDRLLPQIKGVPVVALSARTGAGLDRLMAAVLDGLCGLEPARADGGAQPLPRAGGRRAIRRPPLHGRRPRLDYITQPKARPPTFVLFSSRASALAETYRRYLVNGLRENFALPGTPIRLTLRSKPNPYANRKKRR